MIIVLIKRHWGTAIALLVSIFYAVRHDDPATAVIIFIAAMLAGWGTEIFNRKMFMHEKRDREAWEARQRQE